MVNRELVEHFDIILGTGPIIPSSEKYIRDLERTAKDTNVGQYSRALAASLQLLMDANFKAETFLEEVAPSLQSNVRLVQDLSDILGRDISVEAHAEGLVSLDCSALLGYREPAEVIVEHIGDLTGRDLSGYLKSKWIDGLKKRGEQAANIFRQYTEIYHHQPIPEISSEALSTARETMLKILEHNPTGIDLLLNIAKANLVILSEAHQGLSLPRAYGFSVGARKYINALSQYF